MAVPTNSAAPPEKMSAYLDAELDRAEAEAYESFLAETPAAKQELEDLRRVVSLVSALPPVEAPPDFYERLSVRIRRRQLLSSDGIRMSLVSLPFQVLSILVILAVATVYLMTQLEHAPRSLTPDPGTAPSEPVDGLVP